eukprot:3783039-Alexandrium_andersonii.AAC.1
MLTLRAAAGRIVDNPFGDDAVQRCREEFRGVLAAAGQSPWKRPEDREQAFEIRLLQALTREAGDPEDALFDWLGAGVPIGAGTRLPRAPAVFPRKRRWALRTLEEGESGEWRSNYSSAVERPEVLLEQF